jgi:tetratricopeptide (TPR) repeat protein
VEEFSAAIKIDDTCMEAWKRRGQSRAAMGQDAEAVLDLTRAAELAPKDADIYHQRGLIYFKLVPRSRPSPPTSGRTGEVTDLSSSNSATTAGRLRTSEGRPRRMR